MPARPELAVVTVAAQGDSEKNEVSQTKEIGTVTAIPANQLVLYSVSVGPLITSAEVSQAVEQLQQLGFQPEKVRGRGAVTMIRLLEGEYPAKIARKHLERLKQYVNSAFLLPHGEELAVFAGSFHQEDRAIKLQNNLADQKIAVQLVAGNVEMNRTLLTVIQADQQTAQEVTNHLFEIGLKTCIIKQK